MKTLKVNFQDLSDFIPAAYIETVTPAEKHVEEVENGWRWNDLIITEEDLKYTALCYAENYWYDVSNFSKPESPLKCFYADYGETDVDESLYEDMFSFYFSLCEEYKADADLRARNSGL